MTPTLDKRVSLPPLKPHHFFTYTQEEEVIKQPQIVLPRIHLPYQEEFLKSYKAWYNTKIQLKREPIEKKLLPLQLKEKAGDLSAADQKELKTVRDNLAREENQYIKDQHLQLMVIICKMANKQMHFNNINLAQDGYQVVDPAEPYSVSVNSPKLVQWVGGNSDRTIRRRIKRLQTCGFITGKKFHGWQFDFELLINPDLLLIMDQNNPEITATGQIGGQTVSCGFPEGWRTIRPPNYTSVKGTYREQQIEESGIPLRSIHPSAAIAEKIQEKGTHKAYESKQGQSTSQLPKKRAIKATIEKKKDRLRAADFPDLQHYGFAQAVLLLQAWIKLLMPDRELFTGYICKVEDQIFSQYMSSATTEKEVNQRVTYIKELMNMELKWREKDPERRFTMLPHLWFDKTRSSKGENDYSGLIGKHHQLTQQAEDKEKEHDKFVKNRIYTKLMRKIREYEKRIPTLGRQKRLLDWVETNAPMFRDETAGFLRNGIKPFNPSKTRYPQLHKPMCDI